MLKKCFQALLYSNLLYITTTSALTLPNDIKRLIETPLYKHATWGIYVKDLTTDKVLYHLNDSKMFLPASTTKLFFTSALLNTFGFSYRYHTPVYAIGKIRHGVLHGNLILVGKGDLTLGGRDKNGKIAYTNFDHIDANAIPGTVLTKQDPLNGIKQLAAQVKKHGINQIDGHILVDNRYFQTIVKRDNTLSPIIINDNLLDFTVTPANKDHLAHVQWRPQIPKVHVINQVKTVAAGKEDGLSFTANKSKHTITVGGSIALNKKNIINTYPIKDPAWFAENAFKIALLRAGVRIDNRTNEKKQLPSFEKYKQLKPVAILTSAPLIETAKLILKVSHNLGANLVPLLLATHNNQRTFNEGMRLSGTLFTNTFKLNPNEYHFVDAAGGDDNRVTPDVEINLLSYWFHQPKHIFKQFVYALPILGVDGSLAMVAKDTNAKGHVFAKTGTGVSLNFTKSGLFLTTKALAGYVHTKSNHWLAFMVVVNNVPMQNIQTVFAINDQVGRVAAAIYSMVK